MKKIKTSSWGAKFTVVLLLLTLCLANYQATAAQKETDAAAEASFAPFYPNDEDYRAFNREIAAKVGIDLQKECPVKIAVIDSGADIGHAALKDKVTVYRDYTACGQIKLKKVKPSYGRSVLNGSKRYYPGDPAEKGAEYYLGEFDLAAYWGLHSEDTYSVLLQRTADSAKVYLDTDRDRDLSDEKGVGLYNITREYLSLSLSCGELNLAVTDIAADGRSVTLSSDPVGHGTFIAALIGGECARYQGLAAASELLIYQIVAADGHAAQNDLALAINDALADGAELINLSLSLPVQGEPAAALTQALNEAAQKGVPIIAAAGNYGAAEGTLAYPAKDERVLAAGTLITKESYARGRGINLTADFIPSYNSRADALYSDFVLAPGCAVSAVPGWMAEEYMLDEGSSVAAAVTSACAAHLLAQGAAGEDLAAEMAAAAQSLGYDWCREGAGLVQADRVTASQAAVRLYQEEEYICLVNEDDEPHEVYLSCDQNWLQVPAQVMVAGASVNYLPVAVELPQDSCRTALVRSYIDEERQSGAKMCYTVDRAAELTAEGLRWHFDLKAGQSADYYWNLSEETEVTVKAELDRLNWTEKSLPHGRIALEIYDEQGRSIAKKDFFGISFAGEQESEWTVTIPQACGRLRLTVISSESLPLYNQPESYGWITVSKETDEHR